MTLEADLFSLEGQLLKSGAVGSYLAQIDAIHTMIVTGTGNPAAAIAQIEHVPFETAANAAVSDAYAAGQASAHELINDPAIVEKTAKGKPPKGVSSDIAGLDKEGAAALAKSQKLAALGTDPLAAASPLIAHANKLRQTATSTVVGSGNAGVVDVGTAANMPMVWVAETDACVHCLAYSGQVVTAGDSFPSGLTYGRKPLAPYGQLVAPPLHPYCRCHVEVLLDAGYAEALRREADRSVLRGFSLESESMSTRVDAANRLLEKGVDAPKSVIAYSTKSVKAGKFATRGRPADPIPPTKPQTPAPKPPTPPKTPAAPVVPVPEKAFVDNLVARLQSGDLTVEQLGTMAQSASALGKANAEAAVKAYVSKVKPVDRGQVAHVVPAVTPQKITNAADAKAFARTMPKLTADAKEALLNYSGSHYSSLNMYLRQGTRNLYKGLSPSRRTQLGKVLRNHQAEIDKAMVPMPSSVLVQRQLDVRSFAGAKGDPASMVGKLYEDKAYMSTSLGGSTATGAPGVLMQITVPKGAKAVYIGDNSHFKEERELLLARGSRLAVTAATQRKDGTWLIQATALP